MPNAHTGLYDITYISYRGRGKKKEGEHNTRCRVHTQTQRNTSSDVNLRIKGTIKTACYQEASHTNCKNVFFVINDCPDLWLKEKKERHN